MTYSYLQGSNKTNELKDALESENDKTAQMQEAMKKVDIEMKRSEDLLSQMIPKAVTDKVKEGLNPVDTCEVILCLWRSLYIPQRVHMIKWNVSNVV